MLNFINNFYYPALNLKKRFKATEKKKWDSKVVMLELIVQLGHLTYISNPVNYSMELNRNIVNFNDEVCDILLQLITLTDKLKIKKSELIPVEYSFTNLNIAIIDFNSLLGQVSEVIMENDGYRHFKIRKDFINNYYFLVDRINRLFSIVFSIIYFYKIDINMEFKKMLIDANSFLNDYKEEN